MKAGTLGAISAFVASACCGLPLLLIALGLGGLGLGSVLGTYHWYFLGAGAVLLAVAWVVFLREKRRLWAAGSEIRHARLTASVLTVATAVVVAFAAINLWSAFGLGGKAQEVARAAGGAGPTEGTAEIVFPVEGMTCFTCELSVENALEKLDGVVEAKASAAEGKVLVRYVPGKVDIASMRAAIDGTGYPSGPPLR